MSALPTLYAVIPTGADVKFTFNEVEAHTIAGIYRVGAGGVSVDTDVVAYVPAARLDAANLEIARLKGREKAARRLLRRIAKLFDHACANAKKCDCYLAMIDAHFAKFPDAALTPKEPSDE